LHAHDDGCAITGGTFYAPARPLLGAEWQDGYFFTDYCANELRWLSPDKTPRMVRFGRTSVPGPVDVRVNTDGSLWYLARGNSAPTGGPGTGWTRWALRAYRVQPGGKAVANASSVT
jgi:hypothetical protein